MGYTCVSCGRSMTETEIECANCGTLRDDAIVEFDENIRKVVLTTETVFDNKIIERIEIITAECVFGMNIFKDLFAAVRDVVGGRSRVTQSILKDARKQVLYELKKEAHAVGANAVIAVDLDYSEFSGGGKSMLFVVASGTAVKAEI